MVKQEWSLDEWKYKAEAYCSIAERCDSEVTNKLLQWGAQNGQIEEILLHLHANNYINNARYCNAFAHDKLLYQGWGRIKIRAALYAKHITSQDINDAINSIDETEYFSVLKRIFETKKRSIKASDSHAHEKLIRFCLQRGFTYDEIERLRKDL